MYYIEGTIDSIEIAIGEEKAVRFTLLLSAEFLKTVAEGEKKALFIEKSGKTAAFSEPAKTRRKYSILKSQMRIPPSNVFCSKRRTIATLFE